MDADTKVLPDALTYMVAAMANDITIMGLCGETRIANKRASCKDSYIHITDDPKLKTSLFLKSRRPFKSLNITSHITMLNHLNLSLVS